MLLTALDPALLIYERKHWLSKCSHFFDRIRTLALHRAALINGGQKIAVTNDFAASVYQSFPWHGAHKTVAELRDLRQFVLEDLSKGHYFEKTGSADDVLLCPANVTCAYMGDPTIVNAWKELLCSCTKDEANSGLHVQVATWESENLHESSQSLVVSVSYDSKVCDYELPLVWDQESWTLQLCSQDYWPDLQKCVEFYFKANVGMQVYAAVLDKPIPFECTEGFWKSVDDLCQPNRRRLLVKAIAKKVYGVLDAKLGDERLGDVRRFRVTDFWRVHYRLMGNRIVLEEFGSHDMGL